MKIEITSKFIMRTETQNNSCTFYAEFTQNQRMAKIYKKQIKC